MLKLPNQQLIRQSGVGMIEVLVTLFILSIGLLGVASLQFVSSFSNADALNRSQSVMVAQQLSERLRANAFMATSGEGMVVDNTYFVSNNYNFANLSCNTNGTPYSCYCESHPASIPNCRTGTCTAAQIATFDAYELSCSAVMTNPSVEIELNCNDNNNADAFTCSPGSKHVISLSWPVENWQNNNRVLNTNCNRNEAENRDCVRLEITL